MKSKTVAIAGFATTSLPALMNSQADEIWTLNHAFVMSFAFPRIDRVFEIHEENWYTQEGGLERYIKWLRQDHPFPVYMQEVDPRVPASVKYPFDAVCQDIFGYLLRGDEVNLYYGSSFSYMMALAIYEKVDTIEIYGVEMGNDTEFHYQKPSGELMIGVAMGRRITVKLQPNSLLCQSQLYAYDRVPAASWGRADALAAFYKLEAARYEVEANALTIAFNKREITDGAEPMAATAQAAMNHGGHIILRKMLEKSDYFFGRQYLENEQRRQRHEEEHWLALTNQRLATFHAYATLDTGDGAGNAWKEYLDARWTMYLHCGARQAMKKLIDECDMKVVPDEMRLEIKDE